MMTYADYKESGTFWIDSYPNHWELCKLKFSSITIAGGTPDTKKREYWDGDIPWLPSGVVQNCDVYEENADTFITKLGLEKSAAKMIPSDSILIALTGATCANIAHLHFRASANQSVIAMPGSKKIDNRYLFYSLLAYRNQILINKTGGAQSGINDGNVKNTEILRPTLPEQRQIAAYLDYKTKQIDRFIANRKKQIVLLEERIKSVINESVSHGYEELIKEVWKGNLVQPKKGWILEKLKYALSHIFLGLASTVDYVESAEQGYPFVRATDFSSGELSFENIKYISKEQHKRITKNRRAEFQDILFSKSGYIGNVAIVNVDFEFSIYESVFVLRPFKSKLNYKFLYYLLQAGYFKTQYIRNTVGMGVEHLNLGDVKETYIFYPSLSEQEKIVEFLDGEINSIRELISKYQSQIDLMQEYKTSLISKAVTGKIDVRNWQPKQTLKETL